MKAWLKLWDRFFFAPAPSLPIALFRIVFAFNCLVMYAIRAADWRFYFTDEGFVRADQAIEILPEFYRPWFSWYPTSPGLTLALQFVFLAALVALLLGIRARLAALVAYVLHLAFLQRNFAIVYGADLVTTFFLFALIFAESDRELSLWPRKRAPGAWGGLFGSVGVRLIQLQMCIIYGFSGLEKLKGPSWWDGTAVWAVLGNRQIMMIDTSWLKAVPLAIAVMTFSTILFEVYFPVLVWIKPVRRWLLAFGVVLHGMIALTVGLIFFSVAMMSTYLVFLDEATLRSCLMKLRRQRPA